MRIMHKIWAPLALALTLLAANVPSAFAGDLPAGFPHPTKDYQGKVLLSGFDPAEFGGDDSSCTLTAEEITDLRERVSSAGERCKVVVEWSWKQGAATLFTGVHALQPCEWYYSPKATRGEYTDPRLVGTIHYLPRGYNAHQYAVDLAQARDATDGTASIVGLSPTDDWVLGQLGVKAEGGGNVCTGAAPSAPSTQPQADVEGSPAAVHTCTVTASTLNIRVGPGTNYAIAGTAEKGKQLSYTAITTTRWLVLDGGKFASAAYCK